MGGASELPSFWLSFKKPLPSPSQTSCPCLHATKPAAANSCFPLRLLTVPKQKGQGYVKRKFESETERMKQEQAKLFQIFCTKRTFELQEQKILHRMIERKARLQPMVSDIKTIKDGITYGSMEGSKTLERQSDILDQFYFQIGVKMHSGCLDCVRPCTIVAFRVLL